MGWNDTARGIRGFALAIILVAGLVTSSAAAQDDHRLEWKPEWRRVGVPEYGVTLALLGGALATHFWVSAPDEALWTEPVLWDQWVRDGMRRKTRNGRNIAGDISDFVAGASYLQPLIIDPVIIAGVIDNNPDVAWQVFIISLESYSFTFFLNSVSKRLFARQRPYAVGCTKDPEYSDECEHGDRFRSYYSGHSASTATSAGLVCSHHTHLPLYGGGWIDLGTCLLALAGTLATGTLRIAADKHWLSDVATGHLIGFGAGYFIPSLIYYKGFEGKPDEPEDTDPMTTALPPMPVFSYMGRF
jgi:membrane-associated phospholipid phosphatase